MEGQGLPQLAAGDLNCFFPHPQLPRIFWSPCYHGCHLRKQIERKAYFELCLHFRFLFLNYRNLKKIKKNWTSDFYHVESKLDLLLCRRENFQISVKNASFVLRFSEVSLCAMETFLFKVVCGFSVAFCNSRLRSYEFLSFKQVNAVILLYYELTFKVSSKMISLHPNCKLWILKFVYSREAVQP